ncbi:hypothetical protein IQ06DRAFT_151175 [Phaeosphaeriaceae sp. SRC1lsM3a]|nr:hypothetical protein IQ06DRAFT_151175 [Stagonospora sp. SRC1lsM3a]
MVVAGCRWRQRWDATEMGRGKQREGPGRGTDFGAWNLGVAPALGPLLTWRVPVSRPRHVESHSSVSRPSSLLLRIAELKYTTPSSASPRRHSQSLSPFPAHATAPRTLPQLSVSQQSLQSPDPDFLAPNCRSIAHVRPANGRILHEELQPRDRQ